MIALRVRYTSWLTVIQKVKLPSCNEVGVNNSIRKNNASSFTAPRVVEKLNTDRKPRYYGERSKNYNIASRPFLPLSEELKVTCSLAATYPWGSRLDFVLDLSPNIFIMNVAIPSNGL